ncbi:MAG: hypothetical protein HC831_31145 [Chloroflexia bacterium]|nr:hypothetical protein [Chloroflexia bacterium]
MAYIDLQWGFLELFEHINELYRPGGISSGPARNLQIESWGQLVGRTRALAEFDLAIELTGSKAALSKAIQMSPRTLTNLRNFYNSLPDDRGPAQIYQGMRIDDYVLIRRIGNGGNAEVWAARGKNKCTVALKILKRPKGSSLKRFFDEIQVLKKLDKFKGILPLINAVDTESVNNLNIYWLALPIAIPLSKVSDEEITNTDIVRGMFEVSKRFANYMKCLYFIET